MKHPILKLSRSSIQAVADDTFTHAFTQYCTLKTLKHGGRRRKRKEGIRNSETIRGRDLLIGAVILKEDNNKKSEKQTVSRHCDRS